MIYFLLFINCLSFALMGFDKFQAKRQASRISEQSFLILTVGCGWLGILLGMLVWRHKTQKRSFQGKVLLGFIVNVGLLALLWQVYPL